jgi:hypothetical protein
MDETKIEIPGWLPWATTACLAALVACLGELLVVEKARNQLQRDQGLLADTAVKGMENQLEAERIVSRRALEAAGRPAGSVAGLQVILLSPPAGMPPPGRAPAAGAVVLDAAGRRALVRLSGAPQQDPGLCYELWIEGPGPGYPADCGAFRTAARDDDPAAPIDLPAPFAPGCRFVLVEVPSGGTRPPAGAGPSGPIVLASDPAGGKISKQ